MVPHSAIELYLTSASQEESLTSARLLPEHVAPRDTLMGGSSTGYSTYRGPSATMMTQGHHHATADRGQPASAGTTSNLQAQTASSSTPKVSQQAGFDGDSAGSMPTTTTGIAPDPIKEYADSVGVLATASNSLLGISRWLLSHVKELGMCFATEWSVANSDRMRPGLTSDDQNLHDERIKLWEDFNHAWLAICQRQIEMMESGQRLQSGQILVPKVTLKKMGSELVRLCESIEPQGLVDYQYGVWEEWITDSKCDRSRCIKCALLTTCCQFWRSALICMRRPARRVWSPRWIPDAAGAMTRLSGAREC